MDCFHYVTYGIFALWFSLNQVFVIKFSVSFATVVEVFARQKTLREKPDTFLLQRTAHMAWDPCCLICWKTCIFVYLMPNKCSCHDLHVVLVLFFFYFSVVCFLKQTISFYLKVSSLVSLAHFPRFCWQYFPLSTTFSIHLARKTYFLLCLGFCNIFLTVLLLFCMQNQIFNCWKPQPFS